MGWVDKKELEPLDYDQIIADFTETDQFKDKLYDMCSFSEEFDDYRKWVVISWSPNAMTFKNDLIEYAWDYTKQVRPQELTEPEKQELIRVWDTIYDNIFSDMEDTLIERKCEE